MTTCPACNRPLDWSKLTPFVPLEGVCACCCQPFKQPTDTVTLGELRHTSAGNVYRLERIDGHWRYVRRVSNGTGGPLWDADVVYRWSACQWEEQLPLVGGDTSEYPHHGTFAAGFVGE